MAAVIESKGTGRDTIAVVERAFFVLQVVAAAGGEALGIRELARRTDLSPATVLRLVRTLDALGMVDRRPDGLVVLGAGVASLSGERPALSAEQFVPLLGRLVESFGEAATAAVDDGDETLFLAHVAPASAVQVADVTGDRWPAHTTASGLVLMGAWNADRLDAYLAGDLGWDGPGTIHDPARLRARVEQVREDGFAWSVEELVAEAVGLAVPIVAEGAVVAAVGLYAPSYRLHPDLEAMADLPARLIELVGRLSVTLTAG